LGFYLVCVKDKFVLEYAMKSYGGVKGIFHSFVTSLVGCDWSSLRPGLSTPGAIDEEGRWASEAIWMVWERNKSVIPRIEVRFLGRPGSSIVATLYSRRKNAGCCVEDDWGYVARRRWVWSNAQHYPERLWCLNGILFGFLSKTKNWWKYKTDYELQ
jgi:hypothetical protein